MGMTAFILAGSIHEFSHAISAYRLGDTTARDSGRLTLNPLVHMDIFGSVLFPLVGAISGFPIIGWMKPVPVNPLHFRKPSRGQAVTALAGPFSNLLQAAFVLIILKLLIMFLPLELLGTSPVITLIIKFLSTYFSINILLMVFNLLPVPPLDGGWILRHVLPGRMQEQFDRIYPFGTIFLLLLVFTGGLQILLGPFLAFIHIIIGLLFTMNIVFVCLPFVVLAGITAYFFRQDLKLTLHRLRHSRKFADKGVIRVAPGAAAKKRRALVLKQGGMLLKKLRQGERLDARDEIALFDIKNSRKRNAIICTDNEFDIGNSRCQKCDGLANCFYTFLEQAKNGAYENT